MKPMLILTKNLVLEQELQQQLQHLSYEVFCSVELLEGKQTSEEYDNRHAATVSVELSSDHLKRNDRGFRDSRAIADFEIREMGLVT